MGVYLLNIASHDVIYRGTYNRHALEWVHSVWCIGGGILAVTSAQVSIYIVLFMSIERYVTITYPYKTSRLNKSGATAILASLWTLGILIATIPLSSSTLFGDFYSINGVCLPMHIHEPFMAGWRYSAAIFLVTNALWLLIVGYCYTHMFVDIVQTSRNAHRQILEDMAIAKRFVMIVFTDACCWLPIIVIKILAFCNVHIPGASATCIKCYAWLTIFTLSLQATVTRG